MGKAIVLTVDYLNFLLKLSVLKQTYSHYYFQLKELYFFLTERCNFSSMVYTGSWNLIWLLDFILSSDV